MRILQFQLDEIIKNTNFTISITLCTHKVIEIVKFA